MLTRLDAWLGLHVFHPPVILLCWLLRCTQHRLHRDMWFLFMAYSFWSAAQHGGGWPILTLLGVLTAWTLAAAALIPAHVPGSSLAGFRLFLLVWMLLTDVPMALTGRWWEPLETLWVLVAEYAVTIASLPPPPSLRIRRRRRAAA